MAILPIDLQTLFSQLDKVGKTQSQQTEAVQAQQAILNAAGQKRSDARTRAVNETDAPSDGTDKISDKGRRDRRSQERGGRHEDGEAEAEPKEEIVVDPNLGRNIDVSG